MSTRWSLDSRELRALRPCYAPARREKFQLPNHVIIRMEDVDVSRAKQMLGYPWFQRKEWQREIEHMMKTGVKLEIESLSNRGISFISEEYLPRKLKEKDWLA